MRVLHSFWLELQRRRHEASRASLAPPLACMRAARKSAPPRLAPTSRQQRAQEEEEQPVTTPQAEAASKVPEPSGRTGDQYDEEYY